MRILSLFTAFFALLSTHAIFLESTCTPVYIAMRQQNTHILKNILRDVSDPESLQYGNWLTSKEIHSIIDPSVAEQQQVIQWLNTYSTHNIINHGDAISLCASQVSLVSMFNMPIQYEGSKLILNTYKIPVSLQHIIDFVEMYATSKSWRIKQISTSIAGSVDNRYFGLESLRRLYNVPDIVINATISTAAIEFIGNEGYTNEDMNAQRALNGMTSSGVIKNIGRNIGIDTESELDIQMLSMVNGNTDLWYWNNPHWLYSFAVEFEKTLEKPNIISLSWGWSERNQCDIIACVGLTSEQYVARVNIEFLKMALQGTTIVVSSGDAGAPGRTNEECQGDSPINPIFPGSSPYVLSVGATYVESNTTNTDTLRTPLCKNQSCVTGTKEGPISYNNVGWTAGGGFDSYHNETPWWQTEAVTGYLTSGVTLPPQSNFNRNGRAYPDVAAVGHSCPVVIDGNLAGVDGTSCSAPIFSGLLTYVWDKLWSEYNIKLGFANPLLYFIQKNCQECFNDITSGYNWCTEVECCPNATDFGFSSISGFDPVTGLGTPNIEKIGLFINGMFNYSCKKGGNRYR